MNTVNENYYEVFRTVNYSSNMNSILPHGEQFQEQHPVLWDQPTLENALFYPVGEKETSIQTKKNERKNHVE